MPDTLIIQSENRTLLPISIYFRELPIVANAETKWFPPPERNTQDGHRPSNYSCPLHRRSKKCDNVTVNDMIVGEFAINYILNMLNAKKTFSNIDTPEELQRHFADRFHIF